MTNLYTRLHKYNSDENFITEALVYLIMQLKSRDFPLFCEVLPILAGQSKEFFLGSPKIVIQSQLTLTSGKRPDIAIWGENIFALIEVKVDAPLTQTQLLEYRRFLDAYKGADYIALITLTRPGQATLFEEVDKRVSWEDLGAWLGIVASASKGVLRFLAEELLEFLRWRGLVMDKVGSELVLGIGALRNLKAMLSVALSNVGEVAQAADASGHSGFRFRQRGPEGTALTFWVGVEYDFPDELHFYLEDGELASSVSCDRGQISSYGHWWDALPLTVHSSDFFNKDTDEQCRQLEKFIQDSTDTAADVYRKDREEKARRNQEGTH